MDDIALDEQLTILIEVLHSPIHILNTERRKCLIQVIVGDRGCALLFTQLDEGLEHTGLKLLEATLGSGFYLCGLLNRLVFFSNLHLFDSVAELPLFLLGHGGGGLRGSWGLGWLSWFCFGLGLLGCAGLGFALGWLDFRFDFHLRPHSLQTLLELVLQSLFILEQTEHHQLKGLLTVIHIDGRGESQLGMGCRQTNQSLIRTDSNGKDLQSIFIVEILLSEDCPQIGQNLNSIVG